MIISPLKVWIQNVLPVVYDDSLTYLETVAKINAKTNEIITQTNENTHAIETLASTIAELGNIEELRALLDEIQVIVDDLYSTDIPLMDGTASTGSADHAARSDHVHPHDTGLLSSVAPVMDGTASAGSANNAARSDHVHPHDTGLLSSATPVMDGTASAGSANDAARSDHVHPHDSIATGLCKFIYNKNIGIFGDSISDETINPTEHPNITNVWVKEFRELVAPYNATVYNYSKWGMGYQRKVNSKSIDDIINETDISNLDTIILFAGVNDFFNNIPFGYCMATTPTAGTLWYALQTIGERIKNKDVFVVTPMQTSSRGDNENAVTLEMYRVALSNWCKIYGFHLINGSSIPQFSKAKNHYDDNIHPLSNYTYIIADYIFKKIICEGEAFSPLSEVVQIEITNETYMSRGRLQVWTEGNAVYFRFMLSLNGTTIPNNVLDLKTIPLTEYYMSTAGFTSATVFPYVYAPSNNYAIFAGTLYTGTLPQSGYTDFQINGVSQCLGEFRPYEIT